jgi:hypothetical protein
MANISNIGIPGVGSGIMHPKHKNKYRVLFIGLGRLVPGSNSRDVSMNAIQVDRPDLTYNSFTQRRYNSVAKIMTDHDFSDVNMIVEDDIGSLASTVIKNQLDTQQRLVGVNLDGRWMATAATGSDYKFGMKVEMLDGDENVLETWAYEGCWIKNARFNTLEYASADAINMDLTISIDHAYSIASADSYGGSLGGGVSL